MQAVELTFVDENEENHDPEHKSGDDTSRHVPQSAVTSEEGRAIKDQPIYSRKVPGPSHEREIAKTKAFMAEMRAHFAEV